MTSRERLLLPLLLLHGAHAGCQNKAAVKCGGVAFDCPGGGFGYCTIKATYEHGKWEFAPSTFEMPAEKAAEECIAIYNTATLKSVKCALGKDCIQNLGQRTSMCDEPLTQCNEMATLMPPEDKKNGMNAVACAVTANKTDKTIEIGAVGYNNETAKHDKWCWKHSEAATTLICKGANCDASYPYEKVIEECHFSSAASLPPASLPTPVAVHGSADASEQEAKLHPAVIAGIAAGGALLLLVALVVVLWYAKRRRAHKRKADTARSSSAHAHPSSDTFEDGVPPRAPPRTSTAVSVAAPESLSIDTAREEQPLLPPQPTQLSPAKRAKKNSHKETKTKTKTPVEPPVAVAPAKPRPKLFNTTPPSLGSDWENDKSTPGKADSKDKDKTLPGHD